MSGHYVDMQVKNFLSSHFSVLLEYADSVGFGGFLHGDCGSFGDFVHVGEEFLRDVENVSVVFFRYDEGMSFAEW
jgi:hypothetical protein